MIYLAVVLVLFCIFFALYKYIFDYDYWERLNVPYIKPMPFFGSAFDFMTNHGKVDSLSKWYDVYRDEKIYGSYNWHAPVITIKDPDLIKTVMIKNFNNFVDRFRLEDEYEKLNQHMFNFRGQKWRKTRQKLTPLFTTNKLKNMFDLIMEKGNLLNRVIEKRELNGEATDIIELMGKYATDVIATVAFGISTQALIDDNEPFRVHVRQGLQKNLFALTKLGIKFFFKDIARLFNIRVLSKKLEDFFFRSTKNVVELRLKTKERRNDFIDLILDLKAVEDNNQDLEDKLVINNEFITANSFMFFVAGFETTSLTLSLMFYNLAKNPDVQENLCHEIDMALEQNSGKLTYNCISEMKYLDMVFKETLRKDPIVPFLTRVCTEPFRLPGTNIEIKKNQWVVIPFYCIQRDPKYYPEPEKFIPERFTPEEMKDRHPMLFAPFGEGPRICIGMRLAYIQSKIAAVSILRDYKVEVCSKTSKEHDFRMAILVMYPKDGIWLKLTRRNK